MIGRITHSIVAPCLSNLIQLKILPEVKKPNIASESHSVEMRYPGLHEFRDQFNQALDSVRVLTIFSPT